MPRAHPHVLILSPGSKVALTRALARAVAARGGTLSGWEADPVSPAATFCKRRVEGGPVEDAASAHRLLSWCVTEKVILVVPSRHDDLPTLAGMHDLFAAAGITLALSALETIELCLDKVACHAWLASDSFPIPRQGTVGEAAVGALHDLFPLVAKNPRGSGSREIRICHTAADLDGLPSHWIVQALAPGTEHTINTYVSRDGRCLCEIPHERLLVGDGEVVRACTRRIPELISLARRISEVLPGARGPLNIQIFWEAPTGRATVIEINPRFGGGYPLAHEAGGRFVEWLIAEYIDDASLPRCDDWEAGLTMSRYREACFFRA